MNIRRLVRILIADDDETVRTSIGALCSSIGGISIVGEAEDGEDAASKFEILRPDVLLLDIHMPKLTGIEVLRKIREHDPNAAVIMLTAESDVKAVRECLRAGAAYYILKTNPPDKIRAAIRDLCFKRLQEITGASV